MYKLRSHGRQAAADKFRHMELRRPHRFQGNVLGLANQALAAAAVFDSGSAATFSPDWPHAPHRSALHMTTPVETLPIKM